MATYEQVAAFLSHVTYKPGWQFRQREKGSPTGWGLIAVDTCHDETDAWHPERKARVYGSWWVSEQMPVDQLPLSFRHWLLDCETHEVDEFFRLDGVPYKDPHPTA